MTAALGGVEWSAARPGHNLNLGKTRYPFYRRLGGPQGRSGRVESLVHTGIRSRTVQPVVSRYTDRATRPTARCIWKDNIKVNHQEMGSKAFDCINLAEPGNNGAMLCPINAKNWKSLGSIRFWRMTMFHEVSESVNLSNKIYVSVDQVSHSFF